MLFWITKLFVFFMYKRQGKKFSLKWAVECVSFFSTSLDEVHYEIFSALNQLFFVLFRVGFCGCGYLWFSLNLGRQFFLQIHLSKFLRLLLNRDYLVVDVIWKKFKVWEMQIYWHQTWPLERKQQIGALSTCNQVAWQMLF
jgi:hypothetical protein